jgi:hypothetical protein
MPSSAPSRGATTAMTPRAVEGDPTSVSSEPGYGVPVDADDVSAALESTRVLRLALNVLWDGLSPDAATGPVPEILTGIHDRISEIEATGLRTWD